MSNATKPAPAMWPSPATAARVATGPPKMASVSARRPRRESARASACAGARTMTDTRTRTRARRPLGVQIRRDRERERDEQADARCSSAREGPRWSRELESPRAGDEQRARANREQRGAPPAHAATPSAPARRGAAPVQTRPSTSAADPRRGRLAPMVKRSSARAPNSATRSLRLPWRRSRVAVDRAERAHRRNACPEQRDTRGRTPTMPSALRAPRSRWPERRRRRPHAAARRRGRLARSDERAEQSDHHTHRDRQPRPRRCLRGPHCCTCHVEDEGARARPLAATRSVWPACCRGSAPCGSRSGAPSRCGA